jgi:DNA-binding GntR family transcriptional regulator
MDGSFQLQETSVVPLYHQIRLALESQIDAGTLTPGEQLPSERELAKRLGVSRMTVRQAVRSLVLSGYCYRARGRGIFVRQRHVFIDTQSFEGFTAQMRRRGRSARTVGLASRISDPPNWVRDGLELDDGAKTIELVRLRLIDEEPAVLETEWFPAESFAGLELEDMSQSLYAILETKYQVRIANTSDLLLAHIPTEWEREHLKTPPHQPVIVRDRIGSLADGTPVEAVHSLYSGEHFEFRMNLVRAN